MTNFDQQISASSRRPGIPAIAYALTACIGVIGSNSLALGPIAPEVANALGTDVPAVMSASAVFGLGTAASAFFLGRVIDRFGPRAMLRVSLMLFAVGLVLSAVAPGLATLVAAQFVTGIAAGIALPAIYTLAAVVAPEGRESETIGIVLTGWTLSMVAGVSLAAVLADLFGWRFVYGVVATATLVVLGAISLTAFGEAPRAATAPSPFEALRVKGVAALLVACAAFMASFYGVYAYVGDHLHDALGLSLSANGLVALAYGIGFGGAVFLDGLIDRFAASRLLPAIFLVVTAVYAAMAFAAGSYAVMLVMVLLWGLANHFGLNVLIMRLTALDPTRRGAIMGLNSGVTYLALFAGTAGFGPLYSANGLGFLAIVASGLMLIAAAAAALAPRPRSL
ncbi:MFS transporter [Aquamicrobium sp. LC103]|uniref:MFS transporter n=1 Tax=Aquamicrobium sp. LC103 TaxID=1120658 RepID=UPI00063EC64B|nr:MFS transporter [Aquamicrobium sp. LC103]TKT74998.1 MFS transporter [Aquamicrobium sp. LC103]